MEAISLANKYRPKTFEDMVEQSVIVDILKGICTSPNLEYRNFLLTGPAGTGKAQPLHSKVLTPNGYIEMGSIKLGTQVFTHTGELAKVIGVYPQGRRMTYRMTLSDGSQAEVADNHLNLVYLKMKDGSEYMTVLETRTLIESEMIDSVYVPNVQIPECYSDTDTSWRLHDSIPEKILLSSVDYRYNVLRHMYMIYGSQEDNGDFLFYIPISKQQLAADFIQLLNSLGITASVKQDELKGVISVKMSSREFGEHLKTRTISFSMKTTMLTVDEQPYRKIVSLSYIGEQECQCIYLDHPDHTYITDCFIPTHNTTCARIMANMLNDGKGTPIEIDAASHSGVDAMRELVAQAKAFPVGSKWKVFIIDEAHSLSSAAWQALLLPLESGAGKSIFAMCTTNPEKIPATILSRVQTFQLSKISLQGIHDRLIHVLDSEISSGRDICYDDDAVSLVAKLANGGMRDALTLLDKALAYSNQITTANLEKSLNLPSYDEYFSMLSAYAKKDNAVITQIIDAVYNSGVNFVKWFEGFHQFVINIVKYIYMQDINSTVIPSTYAGKMEKYSMKHSAICLKLASKLLKMNNDLKYTQYLQEVALTYLCFVPKAGE